MVDEGVTHVVMEVSAHAWPWTDGGHHYQVGAFTNFSQDHIDLFGDMDVISRQRCGFFRRR
jgi:UDP-N-acetylmuramyl tripeptide synthase